MVGLAEIDLDQVERGELLADADPSCVSGGCCEVLYTASYEDTSLYLKESKRSFLQSAFSGKLFEQLRNMFRDSEDRSFSYLDSYMARNIAAEEILSGIDTGAPEIVYDEGNDRLVIEDLGPDTEPVEKKYGKTVIDYQSCLDAAASKILVGDTDISRNILADDDGRCYPIDFDLSGNKLGEQRSSYYRDSPTWYSELVRRSQKKIDLVTDRAVEEAEVEERVYELASRLDVEEVASTLENNRFLRSHPTHIYAQNIDDIQEERLHV